MARVIAGNGETPGPDLTLSEKHSGNSYVQEKEERNPSVCRDHTGKEKCSVRPGQFFQDFFVTFLKNPG